MAHAISTIKHPYLKMTNLAEYLEDRQARRELGLVGGKIIFKGKAMSEEEFNAIPPIELKSVCENPDKQHIY